MVVLEKYQNEGRKFYEKEYRFNTYADDDVLTENGKIDYEKLSPVLFEMQQKSYIGTGTFLGKCWSVGKEYTP